MNLPGDRSSAVLLAALFLGGLGDALLGTSGPPGLNLAVWVTAVAGATFLLARRHRGDLDIGEVLLLSGAAFLALLVAVRDAPILKLLALAGAALALALVGVRAGSAWIRRTQVAALPGALAAAGVAAAMGFLVPARSGEPGPSASATERAEASPRGPGQALAVLRGIALALPVLLVVGGLFAEADPRFGDLVVRIFGSDGEALHAHLLRFAFLTWISAGFLRSVVEGSPLVRLGRTIRWRPSIGAIETGTALALLNALFLLFVALQLPAMVVGAEEVVRRTPGLTLAEYARRGFFELVAVATIVGPVLLAADQFGRRDSRRQERIFRTLAALLVGFLAIVMASAALRLRLYFQEFGLTQDRIHAAAFLAWLAAMLIWYATTVLRGRRDRFALGALVTGFAWILGLVLMSPDAVIARVNLARAAEGAPVDAAYLTRLGGDAAPTLVAGLPELSEEARCTVATALLDRWGGSDGDDLRRASLGRNRARRAVAEARDALEAAASAPACSAEAMPETG